MALVIIPPWLEKIISSHVSGTAIVAWWGASAGTVALGWNALRHTRSKGRMKLEGIYQLDSTKTLLPPGFAVRVTNVGSKPVLVQGLAIERKKRSAPSHYFFPCKNPTMLAQGHFFVQVIDPNGWLPTDVKKTVRLGFQWETLAPQQETNSLANRSTPSMYRSRIQASRASVNPAPLRIEPLLAHRDQSPEIFGMLVRS